MRTVAIVQARMGSTRLPGKALVDICGTTMLSRVVERTRRARLLDETIVATTTSRLDDAITRECSQLGVPVFRGSEEDVLDRYYRAAAEYKAESVVRITADCPLIEPQIVDRVVSEFLHRQPEIDYASNVLPERTFPRGLDSEVIRLDALEKAWHQTEDPACREHVTLYIERNPQLFHIHGVSNETNYSQMRWTVDTPEDLAFVRQIYGSFGHDRFSWQEVLDALERHPEWMEVNKHVRQKVV